MRLEHTFTVPVPPDRAWTALLDVERVAPCMPGATLTSFDGERFAGTVKVKVGPVSLTYQGTGRFAERDESARRVVLEASGQDRTSGTASATVTATLHPEGADTRVDVVSDLQITGRAAQYARGMLGDVSGRLLDQFAACLAERLGEPVAPAPVADEAPAPPAEAEAIDLFAVTGVGPAVRRALPYALALVAGGVLVWLLLRRRR
jgi:carbon monoxide dehydrogenase subunit G